MCMLCYNHDKYLAQSIQSVIDQTYENWELVITDNASTDNSRKIIEEYILKDKRIKFYPLEYNSYPSGGINNSIEHSVGEYIAILSADDYFMPNKLEKQIEFMFAKNTQICFTWVKAVNDNNEELSTHWTNRIFNRNFDEQLDLLKIFITQGNTLCAVTALISRRLHTEIGLYDNRLLQTQDLDLWLKIIKKYPITVLKEKLTCYRVRDDGENLSININKSGQVRCITEAIWFMQHICDLDANIISQVIDKPCDENSKYKVLFNYYLENHNKAYATAVLLALYNKLGADFTFPSPLYQDFFEMYSNFDMFDHFGLNGAASQLFIATLELPEFNGEHYFSQVIGLNQRYTYSLSEYTNITRLRLDPINQPAKVKLLSAQVKLTNGENYPLELVWHNADLNADVYDFRHDDPQFVFDIPIDIQADLVSVEFLVDITPYSKWEIVGLLAVANNEIKLVQNRFDRCEKLAHQLDPWNNARIFLHYDTGNGFNNIDVLSQSAHDGINTFEFDLSGIDNLKGLRLDPLNLPARVQLLNVKLLSNDGISRVLQIKWHNANNIIKDEFSFYHDDPIMIFDLTNLNLTNYSKLLCEFQLSIVNVHELSSFIINRLTQLSEQSIELRNTESKLINATNELTLTNERLNNTQYELTASNEKLTITQDELTAVYKSQSWKITKPLRKFCKLFKC